MSDPIFAELDFERVGSLLESLSPRGCGFAFCDRRAEIQWSSGAPVELEVARALQGLASQTAAESPDRQPLGEHGVLLQSPVQGAGSEPVGWLAAWCESTNDERASSELKRLSELLPRAADFLAGEYRLQAELSGAVTELSERYEELNLVFTMERRARAADRQSAALRSMLDSFTRHLRIDMALFLAPEHGIVLDARGSDRRIANVDLMRVEMRGRIWRFISASKKPLVINDPDDPRREFLLTHMPFKALALPDAGCGIVGSGLMLLRHLDEPDFSNSEMSLARVFLGQALVLLRNEALMARMNRFTRQIASSLVEAVEAKDPYTRGHSERVEQITVGIGRECGLAEIELEDLTWGALLHDIGKIGIPDSILLKPGRLTEDEYTVIKTHPQRSYEILRHVEQLGRSALDGARYHQERFDGRGYPFGLSGEEIPLAARIVSVADTYDAITSSRSYRPASTHEKAVEIIERAAGTQLDPAMVHVFCERIVRDQEWLQAIRPSSAHDDDV